MAKPRPQPAWKTKLMESYAPAADGSTVTPRTEFKPSFTAPEKAFWKDVFVACVHSTLHNGSAPDAAAAELCADFADAAMDVYRSRIVWGRMGPRPGGTAAGVRS